MKRIQITIILAVVFLFASSAVQAKWDADLEKKCNATVAAFKQADAGLSSFFNQAYGYAVFPNIGNKQIIFFQNQKAYDAFVGTNYEFSAQASAVAITAGVAAQTSYSNGVAVFTQVKGGLMYEASLGGQQYRFRERK